MGKIGRKNRNYNAEFKISVIMDMREQHLGYRETARKYELGTSGSVVDTLKRWERIFLEEGVEALMKERRGRAGTASGTRKGRPPKLDKTVEENLIAENQRLKMEIDYLKKLRALVLAEKSKERQKAVIIAELRQLYPLKDLLKLSGLARSTFYYYLKSKYTDKYKEVKDEILDWTIVKKVDRGMRKISKAQPRHAGRTKVQSD